jgi:hypothetical protein
MSKPPNPIRAGSFFDGQNLFHCTKAAFGYTYPNYDPVALASALCHAQGWVSELVQFYTGVPDAVDNAFWNHFWIAKGAQMGREGVHVFTRPLRYRNKQVKLPDRSIHTFLDGDEKGIDVRIALDIIRLAHANKFDVAVVFSRDQDLSEVADEVRVIAREQTAGSRSHRPIHTVPPCAMSVASTRPIGFQSTAQPMMHVLIAEIIGRNKVVHLRLTRRKTGSITIWKSGTGMAEGNHWASGNIRTMRRLGYCCVQASANPRHRFCRLNVDSPRSGRLRASAAAW